MDERKTQQIMELTDKILPQRMQKNFEEIIQKFEADPLIYVRGLLDGLKETFEKTVELQEQGNKKEVAYIAFSLLYSKILQKKNGLRIDVLDKDAYLDAEEVSFFWEPKEIFDYVDVDINYVVKYLSSSYVSLKEYEILELYNSYLLNYYQLLEILLYKIVPCIKDMKSYQHLKKEPEVKVVVGEYMDKFHCICRLVEEGK